MFKVLAIINDPVCLLNAFEQVDAISKYFELIFCDTTTNPIDLICKYAPDVVFLDLDFIPIKEIIFIANKKAPSSIPLFIGVTSDYGIGYTALKNGFYDGLIKPNTYRQVLQVLLKCKSELLLKERSITISSPKEVRYLTTSEIRMLKADNNYVNILLTDGEWFTVFNTLSHFQLKLDLPFVRVHKSYIVNYQFVIRINHGKQFLKLKGYDSCIPFTKKYKEALILIDLLKRGGTSL